MPIRPATLDDVPTTYPAWSGITVDEADRIWVLRPGPRGTADHWDVFDEEGRMLATVPSPPVAAEQVRVVGDRFYAIETDSADALHERGVRFHEAIIGASGNPFFLETVRRINRVRRLLSYRSMIDRRRYRQQCEEHLHILDLLEAGKNQEASQALRRHLEHTVENIQEIRTILEH